MPAPTGVPVTFHDDRYIQPSTVTKVTKRKEGGDSVSISFLPLEGVGRFWKSQWEKKGGQHVQSHGEEKPVLHSPADCLIQNKYGHASVKLYSWTLKIEFHLIFTYHKILLFF